MRERYTAMSSSFHHARGATPVIDSAPLVIDSWTLASAPVNSRERGHAMIPETPLRLKWQPLRPSGILR